MNRPHEIEVIARGLPLAVLQWHVADDDRPAVVLLHGYLEQALAWDAVARRLGRHAIAPDHRGHGRSGHVGRGGFYHFWDYVADLDRVIDTLRGGNPVDLVGHSMGGTIASLYAANRPERVRRLVLVEGLGPQGDAPGMIGARAKTFLDHCEHPPRHRAIADVADAVRRLRKANPAIPEAAAERLAARILRPTLPDDPHVEPPCPPGSWVWTWDPLHRARSPWPFDPATFRDHLRRITAPTRLIYGAASPYPAWIDDLAAREAAIPRHDRVTIADAGHLLHIERPEAVADAILGHLDAEMTE